MKKTRAPKTLVEWAPLAQKRLQAILRKARALPELRNLGPFGQAPRWSAELRLVGSAAMTMLNGKIRGKHYATDVLSFPVPEVFQRQGLLGELVVCLPTLLSQASELGHTPEVELQILLAHGVLHLLGLDHERGRKQALLMARWEAALLPVRARGLIQRTS
jgi:probable rRNA maturation factor